MNVYISSLIRDILERYQKQIHKSLVQNEQYFISVKIHVCVKPS